MESSWTSNPMAAMLNPALFTEAVHMTLAAFVATVLWWRQFMLFSAALTGTTLFIEPRIGLSPCRCVHLHAIANPQRRPERARGSPGCNRRSSRRWKRTIDAAERPLVIRWIPHDQTMTTDYAVEIPRGLSLLTAHDPNAKVIGLEEFPRDQWPNVRLVHCPSTSWSVRAW